MKKLSNLLCVGFCIALIISCSVKKDKMINRNFHALTTKFNVLFNGKQAYLKGLKEIEEKHKDNFWKRLQIEPITFDDRKIEGPKFRPTTDEDDEEAETENLSSFDRAEEKAVKAVQKHSMNIDGYEKNKQIDDAYLLLGKARYYTQRFIPAIDAFNYIIANYPKASLIYETKIWRAKTNIRLENEKLAIESLKLLLEVDRNEKTLSDLHRESAHTAMAMAYEKTDTIQKVIEHLALATQTFKNKEQSARNMFVLGQIYSELGRKDSARMVFEKLAGKRKAPAKYRVRANVELAKYADGDSSKTKVLEKLKKLIKNTDNRKFLNALFYQVGVLALETGNTEEAIVYFNKSLRAKHNDDYQKTYAYEKLGNVSFDKQEYLVAGSYYDSVLTTTPKAFENERRIRRIRRKNKGLTALREFEETVKNNDSILKITDMSKEEQVAYFEKHIEKIKQEDEEKKQQMLNAQNFGNAFVGGNSNGFLAKKGKWYFYNDQSVAFGKVEFEKLWGNRPLEDNWRLSDKSLSLDGFEEAEEEVSDEPKVNPRYELSTYIDAIPTDPEVIGSLKEERNEALYQLGLIYKEQFKNPDLAIENLERLRAIKKEQDLELAISYHLYQIYTSINNEEKANEYKDIILTKYADTKFAQVIREPNKKTSEEKPKEEDQVLKTYKAIYYLYKLDKYEEVVEKIDKFTPQVKKSNLIPKLALLKALSIGKYQDREVYQKALEFVSLSYANTEEGEKAKEILDQLKE